MPIPVLKRRAWHVYVISCVCDKYWLVRPTRAGKRLRCSRCKRQVLSDSIEYVGMFQTVSPEQALALAAEQKRIGQLEQAARLQAGKDR